MGRKRRVDKHLPQRVYQRRGTYYFVDQAGRWHNLGRDIAGMYRSLAGLVGDRPIKTVGDLLERYMIEVAPRKAAKTFADQSRQSKLLIAGMGHIPVEDLRAIHGRQYLDARRSSPVSANREFALLHHAAAMAVQWGVIESNPLRDVKRHQERPRDRYVEDEELAAFCAVAPQLLVVWCALKLLTGARQGDLLVLRRDQIRDDGLHLRQRKTGRRQVFEWTPALRSAVEHAKALRGGVVGLTLFCTRRGKPYTADGFRSIWARAMAKHVTAGGKAFREHDLRAKAGTDYDAAQGDAQRLLGHASRSTTETYLRPRKTDKVRPLR